MKTYGQIAYEEHGGALQDQGRGHWAPMGVFKSQPIEIQRAWEAGTAAAIAEYEQRRDDMAATVQAHAATRIAALAAELAAVKGLLRKALENAASVAQKPLAAIAQEHDAQVRSFAYGNVHLSNSAVTREDIDEAADQLKPLEAESVRIINSIVDANIPDENIEDKPPWVE